MQQATILTFFSMLVSCSSQGWGSSPRSTSRPMCLNLSLCQQCTIRKMEHYTDSVSIGHSVSTCDTPVISGKMAQPSSLSPIVTHKMVVTYADMAGADPQTICEAACWTNTCTFAKLYWLDSIANSDVEFGRRVLMLSWSSIPAQYQWGGYCIAQEG